MAQEVYISGATYSAVPGIRLPDSNGNYHEFSDASVTTAVESDVGVGKIFLLADGSIGTGTSQGGGTPSATSHTIYFEFLDNTNQTITGYWDSTFIDSLITGSTPTTIGGKTVTLAQYDGVTWYSYNPSVIPLNTQLIDFNAVSNNTLLDPGTGEVFEFDWYSTSDYTAVDPAMTFSYTGLGAGSICFYDSSKVFISSISIREDSGDEQGTFCTGTLTPTKIPANAKYVRLDSLNNPDATELSLIRTA